MLGRSPGTNGMDEDSRTNEEMRRGLALARAKLARQERWTGLVLGGLTFLAVVAVGLAIGHISGVPWLSHRP